MRLVVLESPFAGATPEDREANITYARRCLRDCLLRGEAPIASHLLYTQPGVFDDDVPAEREKGILAGFAWGEKAEAVVVYVDRGISGGMRMGIERAGRANQTIEFRSLETAEIHVVKPSVCVPELGGRRCATHPPLPLYPDGICAEGR